MSKVKIKEWLPKTGEDWFYLLIFIMPFPGVLLSGVVTIMSLCALLMSPFSRDLYGNPDIDPVEVLKGLVLFGSLFFGHMWFFSFLGLM